MIKSLEDSFNIFSNPKYYYYSIKQKSAKNIDNFKPISKNIIKKT